MSELNPFAVNRAEYMRDLWKYYVPLKELDLETSKALVIEGGRGTGKSTVFLCNCWRNQLAAAENDPAKTIDSFLNKKSVGLYTKSMEHPKCYGYKQQSFAREYGNF